MSKICFCIREGYITYYLSEANKVDLEESWIHYLELVDENPDSDETILQVAEDLLEKCDENSSME